MNRTDLVSTIRRAIKTSDLSIKDLLAVKKLIKTKVRAQAKANTRALAAAKQKRKAASARGKSPRSIITIDVSKLAAAGGRARAAKLSPKRRTAIARLAGKTRWARVRKRK